MYLAINNKSQRNNIVDKNNYIIPTHISPSWQKREKEKKQHCVFVFFQGSSDGGGDQASRGKIVLLKKKVEELEQQLLQRDNDLENKVNLHILQIEDRRL